LPVTSESLMSEKAQEYLNKIERRKNSGADLIDLHYQLKDEKGLNDNELGVVKKALSQVRADYLISRVIPEKVGDWTVNDIIFQLEDEYQSGFLMADDVKRASAKIKQHMLGG